MNKPDLLVRIVTIITSLITIVLFLFQGKSTLTKICKSILPTLNVNKNDIINKVKVLFQITVPSLR